MIPVFRPTVGPEEIEAVTEVLRSGWWGLGPKTREFEEAFGTYVGSKHSVGVNSCTAALHLGLKVLGVEGGEVITTPMTFVSTNHAILYNQATPVFADIEPDTLNIDPVDIARKITDRTRAIVVVHYGGHPVDLDQIRALAAPYGIPILEDAAHAAGALYKGKPIGSISDITCFSFHAVKNLAAGEGGMITTQNDAFAERLRRLRWMGINKDTWSRAETDLQYSWHYEVDELGFKCHLSDIAAAIGLVQLTKLAGTNQRRGEIAARYSAAFANLPWLETPVNKSYATSANHNYVIKVPKRDQLMSALQEQGIATGMHYVPNHLFPLYRNWYQELPVAERVWKTLVTLPLFPDLSDPEIDHIIDCVSQFGEQL